MPPVQFSVAPTDVGRLDVSGCAIAYAVWSESGTLPIVLVHGAGAQMGWWDAVIAQLAPAHRLLALDLSGNGDSGWREDYSAEQWGDEVITVAQRIGGGPALVVGHSLGGRVAIVAAARNPAIALGPVLVDAPVRRPGAAFRRVMTQSTGSPRLYESLEEALASFHLRPHEPVLDRELLLRVGANSFKPVDGGWRLKADGRMYGRIADHDLVRYLGTITAPITLIYGERSAVVDDDNRAVLVQAHAGPTELVGIDGFHHLTLDQAGEVAGEIQRFWEALPPRT